jgi:hypothetical protein
MREHGIFVGLLAKSLDRDTIRGFNEMNNALKLRVEGSGATREGAPSH